MAVVGSNLTTNSSTTDGTSFATASITPTADALIMVAVVGTVGTGTTLTPTSVIGNGITYSAVTNGANVAGARTGYLYSGMSASPTAGAITISMSGAVSWTSCLWSVTQFTGTDTSGTNGSGAIVQAMNAKPANTLTPSVAFTTTPNAANAGFGAIWTGATATAGSAGTGWSLDGNTNQTAPVTWLLAEHANSACPANVSCTFTSGAASTVGIVGVEILPAAAVPNPDIRTVQQAALLRAANF